MNRWIFQKEKKSIYFNEVYFIWIIVMPQSITNLNVGYFECISCMCQELWGWHEDMAQPKPMQKHVDFLWVCVYSHVYILCQILKYMQIIQCLHIHKYRYVFLIWFLINKFYAYDLKCCISMHHLDELLREYDGFLIWN